MLNNYSHIQENRNRLRVETSANKRRIDLKNEFKRQAVEIKDHAELREAVIKRIQDEQLHERRERKRIAAEQARIAKEEAEEMAYLKAAGMLHQVKDGRTSKKMGVGSKHKMPAMKFESQPMSRDDSTVSIHHMLIDEPFILG